MTDNQDIVGGYIDDRDGSSITVSNKAFLTQIERCSSIAQVFDQKYLDDLKQINDLANEVFLLLVFVHKRLDSITEPHKTIFGILSNALNTFLGGFLLLRAGLALQEGILYRSLLESISSVIFLFFNGDKLREFKAGDIKSHATISDAKRMFPAFGKAYGDLSNNYAHIGTLHHKHIPVYDFNEHTEDPRIILHHAKNILWLLYVVSELAFYDASQRRYYWRRLEGTTYEFTPYPEQLKTWRKKFFGEAPEDLNIERVG
ncbi:MAG: hypothetical protein GYA67_14135 [Smithella sp.]|jgi:hypothetical protein|nr:hypothetical protein [Smithella sp.]